MSAYKFDTVDDYDRSTLIMEIFIEQEVGHKEEDSFKEELAIIEEEESAEVDQFIDHQDQREKTQCSPNVINV